jgi:hypothetical protein
MCVAQRAAPQSRARPRRGDHDPVLHPPPHPACRAALRRDRERLLQRVAELEAQVKGAFRCHWRRALVLSPAQSTRLCATTLCAQWRSWPNCTARVRSARARGATATRGITATAAGSRAGDSGADSAAMAVRTSPRRALSHRPLRTGAARQRAAGPPGERSPAACLLPCNSAHIAAPRAWLARRTCWRTSAASSWRSRRAPPSHSRLPCTRSHTQPAHAQRKALETQALTAEHARALEQERSAGAALRHQLEKAQAAHAAELEALARRHEQQIAVERAASSSLVRGQASMGHEAEAVKRCLQGARARAGRRRGSLVPTPRRCCQRPPSSWEPPRACARCKW